MKNIKILLVFSFILSLPFLNSCNKIDVPEITMHELGMENSKTVALGEELHVDANIVAEGKISKINIEFHPVNHSEGDWELEETFTEFDGLKNTSFHEHFDISEEAITGTYHFHLEVIDQEGNVSGYEDEVEVTE